MLASQHLRHWWKMQRDDRSGRTIRAPRGTRRALRTCGWQVLRTSRRDSNDDGFLVFAEGAAEGVGNFADCGVGFDGSEDCGH